MGDKVTRFQKWGWEKKEPSTAENRWRGKHNSRSGFSLKSQQRQVCLYTALRRKGQSRQEVKNRTQRKEMMKGFLGQKRNGARDSGGPTQLEEAEVSYP